MLDHAESEPKPLLVISTEAGGHPSCVIPTERTK
jgi:hypothetical protein